MAHDKLPFFISGYVSRSHDAAIVLRDEDPREALVEAVIQSIETSVEVTCGGVTLHLAAWRDPDHWEEDWRTRGVEDVDEFVLGLVEADA